MTLLEVIKCPEFANKVSKTKYDKTKDGGVFLYLVYFSFRVCPLVIPTLEEERHHFPEESSGLYKVGSTVCLSIIY